LIGFHFINNTFVAVDDKGFHVVHEHSLHCVDPVGFGNFGNGFSQQSIGISRNDHGQTQLSSFVGRHSNIRIGTRGFVAVGGGYFRLTFRRWSSRVATTDHQRMSNNSNASVDVCPQIDFDHVSVFKKHIFGFQG
jgi:hypothetical protein